MTIPMAVLTTLIPRFSLLASNENIGCIEEVLRGHCLATANFHWAGGTNSMS